jgi:very-short-patch-repair endonuclease
MDFSRRRDGKTSEICRREIQFVPQIYTHEKSINGRRKVMDEESFRRIVIEEKIRMEEALEMFKEDGLNRHVWFTSMTLYKEKYSEELKAIKHTRYSEALKGNKHGAKEQPAVVFPKEKIQSLLDRGMSLFEMSRRLDTSEWFIRQNLRYHGLVKGKHLPYRLLDGGEAYLKKLESFYPGITDLAKNCYQDKHAFYHALYVAMTRIMELLWFVKDQGRGHRYHVEQGNIPRDHICWSTNRGEILLSMGLMDRGIEHIRLYCFYKRYQMDFAFPKTNLFVEVDGSFHRKNKDTKRRDIEKEKEAQKRGFRLIRFTDEEVLVSLSDVLDKIQSALSIPSPPLVS